MFVSLANIPALDQFRINEDITKALELIPGGTPQEIDLPFNWIESHLFGNSVIGQYNIL